MATQSRVPTGDGADLTLLPLGAGSHYVEVDDPVGTPDDNTSYVQLPATGSYGTDESFTFAAFSITSSAITSLVITFRAKETGGTRTVGSLLWVNGTRYRASRQDLTTSYADYTQTYLTNPNTGAAWTEDNIEGVVGSPLQQFGINTDGVFAGRTIEITKVYATVDYTEAGGPTSHALSGSSASTSAASGALSGGTAVVPINLDIDPSTPRRLLDCDFGGAVKRLWQVVVRAV